MFRKFRPNQLLILDGAMGTELQKAGLPSGVCPEAWCRDHPQVLSHLHRAYLEAGAQAIYTCTFGANRAKLEEYGIRDVEALNTTLARLARNEAGRRALVIGDMGPTGQFIEPFGDLSFEEAVNIFREQAAALLAGGVDGFAIETMMEIQEARAALIAVKELGNYFTVVTMTYDENGRTLSGTDPVTALITLQSLGANAVGCNCSTGPEEMVPWIAQMKPYAQVPIVAKPNAGLPHLEGGHTYFSMDAETFAYHARSLVDAGANIIGGCCGTTPAHIKAIVQHTGGHVSQPPSRKAIGAVSSHRSTFIFDAAHTITVIGERINPTGKKELQQSLAAGSMAVIRKLARDQEQQGAQLVDVNVGAPGIDEAKVLRTAVLAIVDATSLPIIVDSPRIEAIEQALRVYPGRVLVNSISGKTEHLARLLPLVAKYGAMFILLPLTDHGIPQTKRERITVIKDVFRAARCYGFHKDDIVVDGLVMAVAAEQNAATETLDTIDWCHRFFRVKTVLGISNVSFGMPERKWINAAFLAMAARAGLDLAIINPASPEIMSIKKAADVLTGRDQGGRAYIASYTSPPHGEKDSTALLPPSPEERVKAAIIHGDREGIISALSALITRHDDLQGIVSRIMIPAIIEVGDRYSRREFFLPQLLAGAETMKRGLDFLAPHLIISATAQSTKGTVVLATVRGDIHDIGKNIVALMLKNHGFNVIDLGKDVPTEQILETIRRIHPEVVGLSALMTTTMVIMQDIITQARHQGLTPHFLLGGAVVSPAYARSLDAYYAKDGVEAVKVVEKLVTRDGKDDR